MNLCPHDWGYCGRRGSELRWVRSGLDLGNERPRLFLFFPLEIGEEKKRFLLFVMRAPLFSPCPPIFSEALGFGLLSLHVNPALDATVNAASDTYAGI